MAQDLDQHFGEAIRYTAWPRLPRRHRLTAALVALSVGFYFYLRDFTDPATTPFSLFYMPTGSYDFFSGSTGGFYIELGQAVENPERKSLFSGPVFINRPTAGSRENAWRVSATNKSCGIVEKLEFERAAPTQVFLVSTLFTEHLHIFYRKDLLLGDMRHLEPYPSPVVSAFFQQARTSIGPIGSGSWRLGSYLLAEIDKGAARVIGADYLAQKTRERSHLGTVEAIQRLTLPNQDPEALDMVLSIAAAPAVFAENLIAAEGIGILSVDAAFVASLNRTYDVSYDTSSLSSYDSKPIGTIATQAALACNESVPDKVAMILLGKLESAFFQSRVGRSGIGHGNIYFPAEFRYEYQRRQALRLRNLVLFIGSVFVSFVSTLLVTASLFEAARKHNVSIGGQMAQPDQACTDDREPSVQMGDSSVDTTQNAQSKAPPNKATAQDSDEL